MEVFQTTFNNVPVLATFHSCCALYTNTSPHYDKKRQARQIKKHFVGDTHELESYTGLLGHTVHTGNHGATLHRGPKPTVLDNSATVSGRKACYNQVSEFCAENLLKFERQTVTRNYLCLVYINLHYTVAELSTLITFRFLAHPVQTWLCDSTEIATTQTAKLGCDRLTAALIDRRHTQTSALEVGLVPSSASCPPTPTGVLFMA